jgi:hypothetical protein
MKMMPHATSEAVPVANPVYVFSLLATSLLVVVAIYVADDVSSLQASLMASATSGAAFLGVAFRRAGGLLRPISLYMGTLAVFHLGLAAYLLAGATPPDFGVLLNAQSLASEYLPFAIAISGAGIGAVGIGGMLIDGSQPSRARSHFVVGAAQRLRILAIGSAALWVGVGIWLLVGFSRLGLGFMFESYGAWLSATASSPLPYAYFAIGVGLSFVVTAEARFVSVAASPFVVFAVGGLSLGLRNEVLVPLLTALAARALQGWRPDMARVAAVAFVGLILMGAIREGRQEGLTLSGLAPNPAYASEALAEMGYTVRTVGYVKQWQDEGDEILLGATYWAPLERVLARLSSQLRPPSVSDDLRSSETLVLDRVGPIGFSSIAEALRNSAAPGAMLILAGQGALLTWLERRSTSAREMLLLLVVLSALLLHARNSFTPVPFQLLVGGGIVLLACPPRLNAR